MTFKVMEGGTLDDRLAALAVWGRVEVIVVHDRVGENVRTTFCVRVEPAKGRVVAGAASSRLVGAVYSAETEVMRRIKAEEVGKGETRGGRERQGDC